MDNTKITIITALFLMGILIVGFALAKPGTRAKKECNDGIDNDGDEAIDMEDTGCDSKGDNDETDCGDGVCEGGEVCDECIADCGHCDSCSDTDGGPVVYVQGTISGYDDDQPYENTDYCLDATNLREYYCNDVNPASYDYNCYVNETGSCSNGACVF